MTLAELRAREDEVAREWEWLNETLNRIAGKMAENEDADVFRILNEQARAVGQRRVELMVQMSQAL